VERNATMVPEEYTGIFLVNNDRAVGPWSLAFVRLSDTIEKKCLTWGTLLLPSNIGASGWF